MTGAVGLNIGPLPINNGSNPEGEIDKQSKQHMTLRNEGKQQTNKQRGSMCGGMDTRGGAMLHSLQSLICNMSEYVAKLWS